MWLASTCSNIQGSLGDEQVALVGLDGDAQGLGGPASGTPARKRVRATRIRSTWSRLLRTELSRMLRTSSSRGSVSRTSMASSSMSVAEPRHPLAGEDDAGGDAAVPLDQHLAHRPEELDGDLEALLLEARDQVLEVILWQVLRVPEENRRSPRSISSSRIRVARCSAGVLGSACGVGVVPFPSSLWRLTMYIIPGRRRRGAARRLVSRPRIVGADGPCWARSGPDPLVIRPERRRATPRLHSWRSAEKSDTPVEGDGTDRPDRASPGARSIRHGGDGRSTLRAGVRSWS